MSRTFSIRTERSDSVRDLFTLLWDKVQRDDLPFVVQQGTLLQWARGSNPVPSTEDLKAGLLDGPAPPGWPSFIADPVVWKRLREGSSFLDAVKLALEAAPILGVNTAAEICIALAYVAQTSGSSSETLKKDNLEVYTARVEQVKETFRLGRLQAPRIVCSREPVSRPEQSIEPRRSPTPAPPPLPAPPRSAQKHDPPVVGSRSFEPSSPHTIGSEWAEPWSPWAPVESDDEFGSLPPHLLEFDQPDRDQSFVASPVLAPPASHSPEAKSEPEPDAPPIPTTSQRAESPAEPATGEPSHRSHRAFSSILGRFLRGPGPK